MDELERLWYVNIFRIHFLEKRGTEFQDWFVKLAGYAWGEDFEEVRPYGNVGDWKCDGWRISTGSVFQCYAPRDMTAIAAVSKVQSDFTGAVNHWPRMKTWHFVHNDGDGLPPQVVDLFQQLRASHPLLRVSPWSEPELLGLLPLMSRTHAAALFGVAPTALTFERLGYSDIQPVVDAIAQARPDLGLEPKAPSPAKLEHNKLSMEAADLLRAGRRKERLVESFIDNQVNPQQGERIAQTFRDRYAELKALKLAPDTIFAHLHKLVGVSGSPQQMAAGLAVLSYLFERCDIFEDAPAIQ